MKRQEFISIVGFYANNTLVDRKLMRKVAKKDVKTLLQDGFFSVAVRQALYLSFVHNNSEAQKQVCAFFKVEHFESLTRKFGITTDVLESGKKYRIKFV